MIRLRCPNCMKALGIADDKAGAVAACPECGKKFRVPTPDAARGQAAPARKADMDADFSSPVDPAVASRPAMKRRVVEHRDDDAHDREDHDTQERVQEEEAPRSPRRRKRKKKQPGGLSGAHIALAMVGLLVILGVAGVFLLLQLDDSPEPPPQAERRQGPPAPAPPAELWASKAPRDWPQLVLTNHAEFKGHSPLEGASAFLIRSRDGRTLAATARHLIGAAGGVEPEISVAALDGVIRSWRMYPRTLPEQFVVAEKVGVAGLADEDLDWLILAIKKTGKPLPATPLRLRPDPVQVGDKVYVVGCPYEEEDCKQNIYVGKVTARSGDRFRYDISHQKTSGALAARRSLTRTVTWRA
jgi:hypothetical protein